MGGGCCLKGAGAGGWGRMSGFGPLDCGMTPMLWGVVAVATAAAAPVAVDRELDTPMARAMEAVEGSGSSL